jgi:type IV secretory pathway VirB2 component (pilin)
MRKRKYQALFTFLTLAAMVLPATGAFAATSVIPSLNTFYTEIEGVMSGPVAGLIALVVFIAVAGLLAVARNFEHGFQVLMAGGAGVVMLATAAIVIPVIFPGAGALIA